MRFVTVLTAVTMVHLSAAQAQEPLPDFASYPKLHAYNEFGEEPLYGPDYEQLAYLNPDAPRGGDPVRANSVVWQTFNPFGSGLGQPAPASRGNTYDTLFAGNADELFTAYAYLAEYYQLAEDRSWILFKIRDDATWWDGTPVRASDVAFTIEKQGAEGFPGLVSSVIDKIDSTEVLDERRILIRFTQDGAADRQMPLSVGGLHILPQAFWAEKNLNDSLQDPLFGSGPYRVVDHDVGERLVYERVEDYWGLGHPLNRGGLLAQTITYDTIREREAQKLAFLARDLDQFSENVMERWINGYDAQQPLIDSAVLRKEEIFEPGLQGAQMAFFNLRNPKFQDPRVRRALTLAFDFETMNEQFFFGQYRRTNSYYVNYAPLQAQGAPEGRELALLEEYRDTLSEEAYRANLGDPFVNPITNGGGDNFDQLDQALELFLEAGYSIKGSQLLDPEGQPYEILIEFYLPSFERIWQTYVDSLEQLGISVELKLIDQGVWFENLRTRNYEMVSFSYGGSRAPGDDFKAYFSTEYTNTPNSYGFAGVTDPLIDALVERAERTEDLATLEAIGRLVDRHMRNQNYTILFWNYPYLRLLWWDVFGLPTEAGFPAPRETAATAGWWYDQQLLGQLESRIEAVGN